MVQGTTDLVMGWGLYLDGVQHSLVDSVLGIWLYNIATGARHVCALIRKKSFANAGAADGAPVGRCCSGCVGHCGRWRTESA